MKSEPDSVQELVGLVIRAPESRPVPARVQVQAGRIKAIAQFRPEPDYEPPIIAPAFIDTHTHPLELGLQDLHANLAPATSVEHALSILLDRKEAARESGVLLGFNLEPESLAEHRYPLLAELDQVDAAIPILVYRVDGHSAVVNSTGLELVLERSPSRELELADSGKPTGVLRGRLYEHASRTFKSKLTPGARQRALKAAAAAAAAKGVATIGAMVGNKELAESEWQELLEFLSALPIRAVPFCQTRNTELALRLGLARVGGCVLVDGSFGSHTAALTEDYHDAPGNRGICYLTDNQLVDFFLQATEAGLQTALHAIGDRAVEQVVRCHERLKPEPAGNPLRHRIEHAELLNPNLVARIAELGLVLGVQPAFEAAWGGPDRLYSRRLGDRWMKTNPFRSLLDSGVVLAGGSDAPITPIDPIAGIRAALEHPNQAERVTGPEALAMFTTAAAFSLGLESQTGRLEPGHDADIVLLSKDPRSEPACHVLATYRAGVCLFADTAGSASA